MEENRKPAISNSRKEAPCNRSAPPNKAHPEDFAQESKNRLQLFHDRSGIPQEVWTTASDRIIITAAVGAFDIGLDELAAKARKSLDISSNAD